MSVSGPVAVEAVELGKLFPNPLSQSSIVAAEEVQLTSWPMSVIFC
jgi:hypothetical protein